MQGFADTHFDVASLQNLLFHDSASRSLDFHLETLPPHYERGSQLIHFTLPKLDYV
jgi:hypothetical protein